MKVRLGDVGKIITGSTPKTSDSNNYDSNDIPFIKPSDISDDEICSITKSEYYISEKAREKARILPPGCILISCIGIVGKVGINKTECSFNQQINAIIPSEHLCDTKYVSYAIKFLEPQLQAKANAAVVPILNKSQFSDIQIALPSLEEQRHIAAVLDKVSEPISKRKAQLDKLDELVKSRFVEMFGDVKGNPHMWEKSTIGETIQTIESGWSGNGKQREKKAGEIAVLKVSAVTKGYFIPSECKVLDDQMKIEKYIFPHRGDLLFSRANTREMVGATAVINQDYPELILPDKLWRIRFSDKANVIYMKFVLSSKAIREEFSANSTGTSGSMYNVSMDKFKRITIPLPPKENQILFANYVEQIEKLKVSVQKSLDQLETLKKALMQKYFG